jgi:hypothetical protein
MTVPAPMPARRGSNTHVHEQGATTSLASPRIRIQW